MRVLMIAVGLAIAAAPSAASSAAAQDDDPSIATVSANNVSLSYRITGPANGRPILLIAGTGMQLIEWPPELVDRLGRAGFRVIAFDNRDAGGSTHFTSAGAPDWTALFAALGAGKTPTLPYTTADMANDAVALLDRLGLKRVDLLGVSGGATIAGLIAAARPDRVRSLNVIAANSGNPAVRMPADPSRLAAIPQPDAQDGPAKVLTRRLAAYRALAGRTSKFDEAAVRPLLKRTVARDADPYGVARQGAALLAVGDLRPRLTTIKAPTLVIHGDDDPLISPHAGREIAEAIPDSRFMLINGMGHDIPAHHAPAIAAAIKANAAKSR